MKKTPLPRKRSCADAEPAIRLKETVIRVTTTAIAAKSAHQVHTGQRSNTCWRLSSVGPDGHNRSEARR